MDYSKNESVLKLNSNNNRILEQDKKFEFYNVESKIYIPVNSTFWIYWKFKKLLVFIKIEFSNMKLLIFKISV